METTLDVAAPAAAESSTAPQTVEVPREAKAYETWRQTGKLPGESKPQREKSAPSKETPSKESKDTSEPSSDGETSPASEAADKQGERKRSNAETRLNELLADLKRSGLTPSELKTFKREAQAAATETKPAATEQTEKPVEKPLGYESIKPKPSLEDFDGIESWVDAIADWKADARDWTKKRTEAAEKQTKEITESLSSAKDRYGDAAETTIREGAAAIFNDAKVPGAIKAIVNDSPVMVDLLYAIGSKEQMNEFVALAKSKPSEAIRKAVLMERLIQDELAKAGPASTTEEEGTGRGEDGKFVSATPPVKKVTQAPPPPKEAAGRNAAPSDDVTSASKSGNFSAFREAANRRDVARRNGR